MYQQAREPEPAIQPADLLRRGVALILDTIAFVVIVLFILFIVLIALLIAGADEQAIEQAFEDSTGPLTLGMTVAQILYFIALEAKWGTTLGKRVMRLRVVKTDGSPMSFGDAAVRNVFRVLDSLFLYLVGLISAIFSDQRQRFGDRVANTMVIADPPPVARDESRSTV